MTVTFSIGVDIGGGSAKIGLLTSDACLIQKTSVGHADGHTARDLSDRYSGAISRLVSNAKAGDFLGIGIGLPGHLDHVNRTTLNCNVPALESYPLADRLAERFDCTVSIENDANLAALAEYKLGSGVGADRLLVVTIGTGIGVAFLENGSIFNTAHGTLGDAGHLIVDLKSQKRCRLGCRGCLEALASGEVLAEQARQMGLKANVASNSILTELFAAAESNVAAAQHVVAAAVSSVAAAVASWTHVFAPTRIIFGGGVVDAAPELVKLIAIQARKYAMPGSLENVDFFRAKLGNDAGMIGAGLLALQQLSIQEK